jgi:hypothetical protein
MDLNTLKIVTAQYVVLQDTLNNDQKKMFLEKLRTSNLENLTYFLHISEARGRVLNSDSLIFEFNDNIIKKKIKSIVALQEIDADQLQSLIGKGATLAGIAALLGVRNLSPVFTFSFISTLALQIYKRYLSAAARKCGHLEGMNRDICELAFKMDGLKNQIATLQARAVLCDNRIVRSKEVCKQKVNNQITKIQARLSQEQYRYNQMLQATRQVAQQTAPPHQ